MIVFTFILKLSKYIFYQKLSWHTTIACMLLQAADANKNNVL